MRSCAVALALAACSSDPTLHVVVVHPTSVTVTATTVSVYTAKMFTCQDVEYGNVDAATLEGALVAQETIQTTGTTGSLSGLPRTDDKLIVARGYDDAGNLLAAGCVDKGVVSGAATVEIDTEVAANVSFALADASGAADLLGIATTVVDPNGKALDGRQVWWRVYGPAGSPPDTRAPTAPTVVSDGVWEPAQPECTKNGIAVIHPVPPNLIGGFAVALRVAWAASPPHLFTSFTKIGLSLTLITLPSGASNKYCARHGTSVTCLDNSTGTLVASSYSASVSAGVASLTKGGSATIPPETIALYDMNNGTDVYAATSTCAIANVFGTGGGHIASCPGGADDIMVLPECGTTSAKLLFHIPGGVGAPDLVRVIDLSTGAAGMIMPGFTGAENRIGFNAAGCVTVLDPKGGASTLQQVMVLDYSHDQLSPQTRAIYNCPSCEVVVLPIAGGGVGFSTDTDSRMVVPVVDATGVVLSQDVLLPDISSTTGVHFVERARSPAASVPVQIVSGNFDNDDGTDLLWDLASRKGTAFEVAYARTIGTDPLAALSPGEPAVIDQILVGDVTNDSHDDLIVLGRTIEALPKAGIAVVPTQVQAPDPMLKPDTTCPP